MRIVREDLDGESCVDVGTACVGVEGAEGADCLEAGMDSVDSVRLGTDGTLEWINHRPFFSDYLSTVRHSSLFHVYSFTLKIKLPKQNINFQCGKRSLYGNKSKNSLPNSQINPSTNHFIGLRFNSIYLILNEL